ncbi:telomere silencing protein Zds1 [Aspergillus sp. HF37]|nr:telomere silencing protein Zds1 [Aspergillus sp. HF37]
MQASTSLSEPVGGYSSRRGHVPHLSISDPSHHVTEAIGHMYDDDYDSKRDSKRLSYVPAAGESISTIPPSLAASESPSSPQSIQVQNHLNEVNNRKPKGLSRPSTETSSLDRDSSSASPGSSRSSTDTATTSFPLNDVNYESDPAAISQELSNLAAIRRMSMDVAATGDPDLPSFGPDADMPSVAPSPSADENDTSRLFWVPARLHPELAPTEFKSFLDNKADHIKRTSGDFSSLAPERAGSTGGLRRTKSTLSRQIDNSSDFTDGAERLERKRSQAQTPSGPNLQELETIVDDTDTGNTDPSSITDGVQKLGLDAEEDKPILPPPAPGASSGVQQGLTKLPGRDDSLPSTANSSGKQPILGLTRVSTDPTPDAKRKQNSQDSARNAEATPPTSTDDTPSPISDRPTSENQNAESQSTDSGSRVSAPPQTRQWHSRLSSNGRSTLNIPPSEQKIPEIVETPPAEPKRMPSASNEQPGSTPDRESPQDSRQPATRKVSARQEQSTSKRTIHSRQTGKEDSPTLDEFASNPQRLPGNTTRTDSLSFIPSATEDRKPEGKKSKDKKETEGSRKSSWQWLLGTEDKEKKKEKESDSKKIKSKLVDKVHDTTRLDILQPSADNQKGREGHVPDRLDSKLEEERRKDHARRSSGETKKEKESGLFSSIFGGGKKKTSADSHHKKSLSRNLSPDPPVRVLKPDLDYPWTRFSILEERAIYRMAHIKLANPRRALHSQVLLSNFMYSYLAKVQQMQPQMMVASGHQRSADQAEEYLRYQRYQELAQEQQYDDSSYDDPRMYEYADDPHDHYRSQSKRSKYGHDNGSLYGHGHYQYGHSTFGDDAQLDDDDDDMW